MCKKTLLACLLVAGLGSAATAAPEFSASAEAAYYSRYVFRGVKLGGEAFQPAVTATIGSFDLGYWANHPFDSEESVEHDYTAGFSWSKFGIDWRTSAVLYSFPQAEPPLTKRTHEFSLTGTRALVARDELEVSVSGSTFYDVRLDALTFEATLNATRNVAPWLALTAAATAGHVSAYNLTPYAEPPKVADAYGYAAAKLEARVTLGERGYARFGGQWDNATGLNDGEDDLGGNLSWWAAVGIEW